jgi:hypothetical protein
MKGATHTFNSGNYQEKPENLVTNKVAFKFLNC